MGLVSKRGGDQGHRDVALDAVDARPGRNEREDVGDQVNEQVRGVVLAGVCG